MEVARADAEESSYEANAGVQRKKRRVQDAVQDSIDERVDARLRRLQMSEERKDSDSLGSRPNGGQR